MKKLILVRHGESIQNVGVNSELRMPDHAVYLTEKGKQQAIEAGKFLYNYLPISARVRMWTSPYTRTRETAELIDSELVCDDKREDDMLAELQFGIFDNIPKDKIKEVFPIEWESFQNNRSFNGKFYARRPGGESPFDCEIRQRLFIDTLFRDFQDTKCPENIIIVGHGAALTLFRKAMFHYTHEWYAEEPNPGNCSIQLITLDNKSNTDAGYIYGESDE